MSISLGRSLIASMNGKNYNVTRRNPGSYVNGKWVEGSLITPLVAFASIQPMTGREMMRIPEGDRNRERKIAYSADLLKVAEPTAKTKADILNVDGQDFQVESVEPWTDYWKAVIVKVNESETT